MPLREPRTIAQLNFFRREDEAVTPVIIIPSRSLRRSSERSVSLDVMHLPVTVPRNFAVTTRSSPSRRRRRMSALITRADSRLTAG